MDIFTQTCHIGVIYCGITPKANGANVQTAILVALSREKDSATLKRGSDFHGGKECLDSSVAINKKTYKVQTESYTES